MFGWPHAHIGCIFSLMVPCRTRVGDAIISDISYASPLRAQERDPFNTEFASKSLRNTELTVGNVGH